MKQRKGKAGRSNNSYPPAKRRSKRKRQELERGQTVPYKEGILDSRRRSSDSYAEDFAEGAVLAMPYLAGIDHQVLC